MEKSEQAPQISTSQSPPNQRRLLMWVGAGVVSILFFMLTSPPGHPSILLLAGFVSLALLILGSYNILMSISGLERKWPVGIRRSIGVIVVMMPVILLMLQSTGQLTIRDCLTLGALCALGWFYAARLRRG